MLSASIALTMKKFLLILMLILPLQASWAVVGVYCQQEREVCVGACYSDDQGTSLYSSYKSDPTITGASGLDQYEHSCHSPFGPLIPTSVQPISSFKPDLVSHSYEKPLSSRTLSERPERPQWRWHA